MRFPFDSIMLVAHASRTAVFDDDPFGERLSCDLKVRSSLGWVQISPRRAHPPPVAEGILKEPGTFLCGTVIVGIKGEPRFLAGVHEDACEGVLLNWLLHFDRSVTAS